MDFSTSFRSLLGDAIAHSKRDGVPEQLLIDHVAGVARLACEFALQLKLEHEAKLCAYWHDLGKLTAEFQEKLIRSPEKRAYHKGFGAMCAAELRWPDIAFIIAGHHGGLPDISMLSECWDGNTSFQKLYARVFEKRERIPELFPHIPLNHSKIAKDPHGADLRTRLLYSCLVDADFLDTEAHYAKEKRANVRFPTLNELAASFQANHARLMAKRSADSEQEKLFALRREIFEQAVKKSHREQGIYSLTVPTGGGKSRTALGFALNHAARHKNIQRVIVALPYTSVLDQLAQEYEEIFGKNNYLLHYTGWQSRKGGGTFEETPEEKAMILAAENWDAPLILTTTVQLFDSLFSNMPSDCRKLHRIANSIIILDEVQTLPLKYLDPICDLLGRLVRDYGTTVLLSTATQPALDRVPSFGENTIVELVDEPAKNYRTLKRVNYQVQIENPWPWKDVAVRLLESESGMVIVNTKKHALELFELVKAVDTDALHLSTFMCGAHRRQIIEEIRNRLKRGLPCRVIATQLVEAGVDLDFPLVMRSVGPLDRIVQAAGRCNREGKLGYAGGMVIVFKPKDNVMPKGSYAAGAGHFEAMFRSNRFIPDDPAVFPEYFARLFEDVKLDGKDIQDDRKRLKFATVGKNFHLIDEGAAHTVYVGFGGEGHRWEGSPADILLKQIPASSFEERRSLYRRLQPYSVQVLANALETFVNRGLVTQDKLTEQYHWSEAAEYSKDVGIAGYRLEIGNMVL